MIDFRQPYEKVTHPVLGEKYVQDGRYFFLDGSDCHADPKARPILSLKTPEAPPDPEEQAPDPGSLRIETPGEPLPAEVVAGMSWIELVNTCRARGRKVQNKADAIAFLTGAAA